MKILKNVEVAKRALLVINFMAVLFYSSVYLSATKYIIENNFSRSLLEKSILFQVHLNEFFGYQIYFLLAYFW